MIQPINFVSSQYSYRGKNDTKSVNIAKHSKMNTAIANASGLAASAGILTTVIAKNYTSNWFTAIGLGSFGAFLSLLFMTPRFFEKIDLKKEL